LSCDIPGVFYSFSFDPYLGETFFPPQKEILAYLRRTSDKYRVTPHIVFNTFFAGAKWDDEANHWTLTLKDVRTNESREETVDVLVLAIGGLVVPNECNIPGAKDFQGPLFHSARWRHDVSLKDKNVVVVGNGCSASQIIPAVINETKSIIQFIRTPQWYLKSNNFKYPGWAKWVLKRVPGMLSFWRFVCWLQQRLIQFVYALLDLTFILLTKDYTPWRLKVEDVDSQMAISDETATSKGNAQRSAEKVS
jgi:cation diffusion facilitator CzcD-associated flavoprotein CzcO